MANLSLWQSVLIVIGFQILIHLAWTIALRTFPHVLGEALVKGIQHGYDSKLEQTKAEFQESLETAKSSVDYLSSMQSELRFKVIDSAEILWKAILSTKSEFSDIVFLQSMFYPNEINSFLHDDDGNRLASVKYYSEPNTVIDKMERISPHPIEETRLFVGERLWYRFITYRAYHGRLGVLMRMSLENREYSDWRKDDFILSQLRPILDDSAIDDAIQDPFGGTEVIVSHLESEFLREATRVMSGSQALADSLSDIRTTLLSGAQMTRERKENR